MSKRYVCGFAFTGNFDVLLIEKRRPAWQNGKLNGIGGRVEPTDATDADAMSREFAEETGISVPPTQWRRFAEIEVIDQHVIDFFTTVLSDEAFHSAQSKTDEPIRHETFWDAVVAANIVANLAWLIPLARHVLLNDPSYSLVHVESRKESA